MARSYILKRRAESQAETRWRIVDAAIELHGALGPAKTTISMIAERAGVQRHTLYSHFPDERAMLMACSGRSLELHPLPDAEKWRAIAGPAERLRAGLNEVYLYFAQHEALLACVLRDIETHDLVREIAALRYGPRMSAWHEVLGVGLKSKQRAMLTLALSFHAWRTLTRDAELKHKAAVAAMVGAVTA